MRKVLLALVTVVAVIQPLLIIKRVNVDLLSMLNIAPAPIVFTYYTFFSQIKLELISDNNLVEVDIEKLIRSKDENIFKNKMIYSIFYLPFKFKNQDILEHVVRSLICKKGSSFKVPDIKKIKISYIKRDNDEVISAQVFQCQVNSKKPNWVF